MGTTTTSSLAYKRQLQKLSGTRVWHLLILGFRGSAGRESASHNYRSDDRCFGTGAPDSETSFPTTVWRHALMPPLLILTTCPVPSRLFLFVTEQIAAFSSISCLCHSLVKNGIYGILEAVRIRVILQVYIIVAREARDCDLRSVVSAEEIGNSTLEHLPHIRTPLLFPPFTDSRLGLRYRYWKTEMTAAAGRTAILPMDPDNHGHPNNPQGVVLRCEFQRRIGPETGSRWFWRPPQLDHLG